MGRREIEGTRGKHRKTRARRAHLSTCVAAVRAGGLAVTSGLPRRRRCCKALVVGLQVQSAAGRGAGDAAGDRRGGAARAVGLPPEHHRQRRHLATGTSRPAPATTANGESNPRGYQVGMVQPLFRGFRTVNAVQRGGGDGAGRARDAALAGAERAAGGGHRLQRRGARQAIVRLRENNVTVLTRDLRATQDRFNVGEVTRTDVAQAQARRAAAVAALDLARANLKTRRATFERVVGHPPSNLVEARASTLVPKTLGENVEISLRESPSVVAALYREQAARFSIDLIRGELLPTAQLEANYCQALRRHVTASTGRRRATVTGRLTVPFYTGGEVQARVRQAKQTHIQRLQEIEQARTETQAQVVAAWSQLQAAQAAARIGRDGGERQPHRAGRRARGGAGRPAHAARRAQRRAGVAQLGGQPGDRPAQPGGGVLHGAVGHRPAQRAGPGRGGLVYDPEAHYTEVRRKWFDINITHSDGRREVLERHPARPRPREIRPHRGNSPSDPPARQPAERALPGPTGWCSVHASAIENRGREKQTPCCCGPVYSGRNARAAWE